MLPAEFERALIAAAEEVVPSTNTSSGKLRTASAAERDDALPPSPSSPARSRLADRAAAEEGGMAGAKEYDPLGVETVTRKDEMELVTIDALPPDALMIAMEFVGVGRYRFVAGTCRRLRGAYVGAHPAADGGKKATYWSSAAESIPCAAFCIRETDRGEENQVRAIQRLAGGDAVAPRDPLRLIGEAAAERTGRLDVIQWLEREHGFDADEHWGKERRETCHKNHGAVNWKLYCGFHENLRTEGGARLLLDCAARGGNLRLVRHFVEYKCFWDNWTVAAAAAGGHLTILKYLLEQTSFFTVNTSCLTFNFISVVAESASRGHREILQFLHDQDVAAVATPFTLRLACKNGHLDVIKFLHGIIGHVGAANGNAIMRAAAEGGHRHVLEYLHTQGFPLSPSP